MAVAEQTGAAHVSSFEIEQVGSYLGAEIKGISLAAELTEADVAAIEQALADHAVLVFRDQQMTSQQFMAFGRRFGALSVHPFSPADHDNPELIVFRNDETNPPFSTDVWHSDETFREAPPMATMLRALDVPKVGGDTMFASMSAAYEGLSDRMQNFISGLEAYHDFKVFKALFSKDREGIKKMQPYELDYPPALHPVVTKHPVTGRKVIFVNPQFTIQIKGMEENESRALLNQLFELARVPEYQYRHHWTNNTLVFWDNRSTQHYAVHDYFPKKRYMERVTIKGTAPLPAFAAADAEGVRNRKSRTPAQFASSHGGHAPRRPIDKTP